ncbi:MAG: DedA family protein [Chloroflexi bacterium]|nr:DedA family protein [Chloroflexota bacterium]
MELITDFIDFFIHFDEHLNGIIDSYGPWTYLLLFLIIFAETGLVIAPILPGDSLLMAAATFAALGELNLIILYVGFMAAAIIGDSVNYAVGHYIGSRVFKEDVRFFKREYLDQTKRFYEQYGGKAVILARYVPVMRTFVPFVAGVSSMTYDKFITYNVVGNVLWVMIFVTLGFLFGTIPAVKENFTLAIMAIIFISLLPGIINFLRARTRKKQSPEA